MIYANILNKIRYDLIFKMNEQMESFLNLKEAYFSLLSAFPSPHSFIESKTFGRWK